MVTSGQSDDRAPKTDSNYQSNKIINSENPTDIPGIILINMNGMQPSHAQKWKIKALEEKVKQLTYPVPFVIVTESHMKPHHIAAEVAIENYNVHRADRVNRKKGGVAVYYHNNLIANDAATHSDDYCQAVILYIKTLNLIIVGVYRPPNARDSEVKCFRDCINAINLFIQKYPNAEFQMYGDFNMKFIDWQAMTFKPGHGQKVAEQNCADILLEFMQSNLLSQHVNENTRKNQSVLDLTITNNPETIHSIIVETTNLSDHDMITTKVLNENLMMHDKPQVYSPKNPFDQLNWAKAKWDDIRKELSEVDWNNILDSENKSVDQINAALNDAVAQIANKHCQKYKSKSKKNDNIPRERRSLIRTRKHINSSINHLKYVKPVHTEAEARNILKKIIKLEDRKVELEEQIKQSIKDEERRKEEEAISQTKRTRVLSTAMLKVKEKSNVELVHCKTKMGIYNLIQKQWQIFYSNNMLKSLANPVKMKMNQKMQIRMKMFHHYQT